MPASISGTRGSIALESYIFTDDEIGRLFAEALADDWWAVVGTANLDYRSFFTNYELNLVARDARLASRPRECFVEDLGQAEQVAPDQWDRRGWSARMSEAVVWTARRWL